MAAKKDAPAEEYADEEAGLVPKALDPDEVPYDERSDGNVDYVVADVPVAAEEATSPDAGPPHSTPSSPADVSQARALWEDQVNADAAAFANLARDEYIRATLGGFPVSIVVDDGLD